MAAAVTEMLILLQQVLASKGTLGQIKAQYDQQKGITTVQSWTLAIKISRIRQAALAHQIPHLWAGIRNQMIRPGFGVRMIEMYFLVGDYHEETRQRLLAHGINPRTCSFRTLLILRVRKINLYNVMI